MVSMSPSSTSTRSGTDDSGVDMAPSTLELLVLTFNCAKNLINVPVFANHLQAAIGQNAPGLPDLVAFSLQEVAPMSYSFVGGYFLNAYFSRFEQALNLAAVQYNDENGGGTPISVTPTTADQPKKPYGLVSARNVGYTAILLFARDPDRVHDLQTAEVGFGAAEMGNKGAVGLRCLYEGPGAAGETEVTFVATHLAAMEWNLARRNANWASIVRGLTFANPEELVSKHKASTGGGEDETRRLLSDQDEQHQRLQRQLHDISVFRPSSHLFVAGDLNYRTSTTSPPPGAPFPNMDPESENYYMNFWPRDQLTREKDAGRTLHGMSEAEVKFPPTYKYDIKPGPELEWSFAPHRYPSWTDRILYLDTPHGAPAAIEPRLYDALPLMETSDHRPVVLRASVPLLAPADMDGLLAGQGAEDGPDASVQDPRVRLPIEIDPEAWGRRAAARSRELMAGWSMMLWSTKEGAVAIGTIVAVGATWYYLSNGAAWWWGSN